MNLALIMLVGLASFSAADEIAFGDVSADGSLETRSLDVPVAMARGADNFYISNPMDSHDWAHTSIVRNSLLSMIKAGSTKVASFESVLRPIFSAMPKDPAGRLSNGTARYALHRYFNEKHGWSIKGLQPAGASWMSTMSVDPSVKDLSKYIVPTFLQQMLSEKLGVEGYDLRALALLAAAMEHLIHAEKISIVYSVFTTLGLPVPGKKSENQIDDILDTFMMVYAFGVNLESSSFADLQKAKAHLQSSHSGWSQMQLFARGVKKTIASGRGMDFAEIVQLVEKIGEGYVQWQGKDCQRVKNELVAKPSHREGRVVLSEVQPSHASGRRTLFTESAEDLGKLGVLSEGKLIIPNYINSQSMCLSTASFYTACCVNECDGLLAKLEREIAAPTVEPSQLARLVATLPGREPGTGLSQALLQEIPSLANKDSGLVALHGRPLAEWMHRAFPLGCPAPNDHKVTNPKTPDEWIGESGMQVADLEEMMAEIAQVLAQYTTMGKKADEESFAAEDDVSDPAIDIIRIKAAIQEFQAESQWNVVATSFRIAAMASMVGLVGVAAKSGMSATSSGKDKGMSVKDFV